MKKLFLALFVLFSIHGFSQAVISRAGQYNTVTDERLKVLKNFVLPTFTDTLQANINIGVDSCGAVIFTYNTNSKWTRLCNPKRWARDTVGGGGGGGGGSNVDPLSIINFSIPTDGTTDATAAINTAIAAGGVPELLFDQINKDVKITGTVIIPKGKRITFKYGCRVTGAGNWKGGIINCDNRTQCFANTGGVTDLENSVISVRWFGAKADYRDDGNSISWTDNRPIFNKALHSFKDQLPAPNFNYYRKLYIPASDSQQYYKLDSTWILDAAIEIAGDGIERTNIEVEPNMVGIWCRYPAADFSFKGSRDLYLHDFTIYGANGHNSYGTTQYDGTSHGIWVQTNLTIIERVSANRFNGDGFCIQGNVPATNANNCLVKECRAYNNNGSGIYFDGSDGNQVKTEGCDFSYNARWGYHDGSFLGCEAWGVHTASNSDQNFFSRTFVSNGGSQYYCIQDNIFRVSHNGNRYRCILSHIKTDAPAVTEPGVGSSWATYWALVGPGGPNAQYVEWSISTWQLFTTAAVAPGVSANWKSFWEFIRPGGFDPGSDTNPNTGFVKKYTDSTQWYTGGGFFLEDGNAVGVLIGCYAEQDQHLVTNSGESIILGGFAANYGLNRGAIGMDQGNLVTPSIELRDPFMRQGLKISQDTISKVSRMKFFTEANSHGQGWVWDGSDRVAYNTEGYENDPLVEFNRGTTTYAARYGLATIPTHGAVGFGEGIYLGRDKDESNKRYFGIGTVAPSSLEHATGEYVIYVGTDSTILGFKCISGGTPGTWVTEKTGNGAVYSGVITQDEGTPIGSATTYNYVGGGVTASWAGGVATINIPGASTDLNAYHKTGDAFSGLSVLGITDNFELRLLQGTTGLAGRRISFLGGPDSGRITYGSPNIDYGYRHNYTGNVYYNDDVTFNAAAGAAEFKTGGANHSDFKAVGNNLQIIAGNASGGLNLYSRQGSVLELNVDNGVSTFQHSVSFPSLAANTPDRVMMARASDGSASLRGIGIGLEYGNTNLQLKGYQDWNYASTTTTDATVTTSATISGLPSDGFGTLEVDMIGMKTDGSKGIVGKKYVKWKTVASTATITNTTTISADDLTGFSTATWTVDANAGTLRIRVTGEAATTVRWSPTYKLKYDGSGL